VLAAHVVAVALIQATAFSVQVTLMPMLVQKGFAADKWQTLLITASPTALFVISIIWNDIFSRRRLAWYLAAFWLAAGLPLALVGAAQNYWMVLVPHLVSCIGACGYYPVAGEMFKRLYPERSRGRVYAIIWGSSMVAGIFVASAAGNLLEKDGQAFRWIMPAAAGLQLAGVVVLWQLARATGVAAARDAEAARSRGVVRDARRLARTFEPVLHMREVLRADPVFLRYEAAYMTYGVGWMIAFALLPLLANRKLGLGYAEYAHATQIAYQVAIVAMIWPAGWLMDRLGAMRSVGLSFGLLSLYPLGLAVAGDVGELTIVSVVYGVAHAGASVGWMLGPVSLAPTAEKAPQYVAIHATLVGLRGTIFQFLGVALYAITGSFTWPLLIAAVAYLWSAVQMWQLERAVRGRQAATAQAADPPAPQVEAKPEAAGVALK
jgi:MFS family permease